MALNFKGIEYRTEWLEYPDVAPTLAGLGVPAKDESPSHTIPTAQFDGQTIIMDSKAIAQELERRHPSPSLHLDSPLLSQLEDTLLFEVARPSAGIWMPLVPRNLLNPRSAEYFYETRAPRVGPLDQFEKEKGGETGWSAAKAGFDKLADLLKQNRGPFVLGETPSYGDFVVVSYFYFLKRVDVQIFERALAQDESFPQLYRACEKWLQKDA